MEALASGENCSMAMVTIMELFNAPMKPSLRSIFEKGIRGRRHITGQTLDRLVCLRFSEK